MLAFHSCLSDWFNRIISTPAKTCSTDNCQSPYHPSPFSTHRLTLGTGASLCWGLCLAQAEEWSYILVCLSLTDTRAGPAVPRRTHTTLTERRATGLQSWLLWVRRFVMSFWSSCRWVQSVSSLYWSEMTLTTKWFGRVHIRTHFEKLQWWSV